MPLADFITTSAFLHLLTNDLSAHSSILNNVPNLLPIAASVLFSPFHCGAVTLEREMRQTVYVEERKAVEGGMRF